MQSESPADYCNRQKILLLLERMADYLLTERPNDPIEALQLYLSSSSTETLLGRHV